MEVVTRARLVVMRKGGRRYEYAEVRVLLAKDYAGQEFVIIPRPEYERLKAYAELARIALEDVVERAIRLNNTQASNHASPDV